MRISTTTIWSSRSRTSADQSWRAVVLAAEMLALLALLACVPAPRVASLIAVDDGNLAMGTILDVSLLVEAGEEPRARRAIARAIAQTASLDAVVSRFQPASDLSQLNERAGQGPVAIDPRLYELLARAEQARLTTAGAFDVTVGPVVALWARAGERNRRPRADELGEAVALVGQPVVLGPGWRASLPNPGMSVDLGGIAKGFALDTVARDLIAQGFTQGLLSFGESSIWALGAPADGPAWRLAVRADDGDILGTLDLRDQALSLSSSLGQSSEIEGRRYGHVVDPRSGEALTSRRRAIVVAGSATRAEILSTALLILDQREASALLAREDAEAFVTDEEGHHWQTRGWQAATAFEVSPRPRALGVRSGPSRGEEVARVRW